ncbi:helix-turn-helix domain-containing protein [Streptomyces lichenis]|uniref:Helix-turn-helix domain-containing protein n=1 Tax=Streptomyces lichenis TaxID=2306967 RepID=A0ABT0I9W1_9ACTN|nr:helix-turn-helix transcriptional regulator [Streptomyces lichenis]MCK8678085.1 helix-turn-helix domain-containing protein [Streptomyces lichenis]
MPTAQHMVVGRELRRLRSAVGLQQKDAATRLGISTYILSRNETGETPCKTDTVYQACSVYGATSEERDRLLQLLAEANEERWWQGSEWRGVAKNQLLTLISLEEAANLVRVYDRDRFPGLLHTRDYAYYAIAFAAPEGTSKREIKRRTELRMERQRHFHARSGIRYICILDELCLRRTIGTPDIMIEQMEKLLSLADDPRYSFRMIPVNGHNLPTLGPTVLFDFEQPVLPTVLYEDRAESAFVCQEPDEVDQRKKRFDRLLEKSMTTLQTKRRIGQHIERIIRDGRT